MFDRGPIGPLFFSTRPLVILSAAKDLIGLVLPRISLVLSYKASHQSRFPKDLINVTFEGLTRHPERSEGSHRNLSTFKSPRIHTPNHPPFTPTHRQFLQLVGFSLPLID